MIPFLLCGYGLWLVAGLPLLKGYEYLTIRDLRAQAGVPGARRGGLWGFWRWPFAVRFALYFLVRGRVLGRRGLAVPGRAATSTRWRRSADLRWWRFASTCCGV